MTAKRAKKIEKELTKQIYNVYKSVKGLPLSLKPGIPSMVNN
jgi:hypothetical protein